MGAAGNIWWLFPFLSKYDNYTALLDWFVPIQFYPIDYVWPSTLAHPLPLCRLFLVHSLLSFRILLYCNPPFLLWFIRNRLFPVASFSLSPFLVPPPLSLPFLCLPNLLGVAIQFLAVLYPKKTLFLFHRPRGMEMLVYLEVHKVFG